MANPNVATPIKGFAVLIASTIWGYGGLRHFEFDELRAVAANALHGGFDGFGDDEGNAPTVDAKEMGVGGNCMAVEDPWFRAY